jgi:hypothetical protein
MRFLFFALAYCLLCTTVAFCRPRPAGVVSLANEKVYINPFVDSSSLQSCDGWPKEASSQKLLSHHFQDCYKNLFAEFKRCEKFGFYEMVEDSSAATVRIRMTVRPYSISKDTLHLPVRIELVHATGLDTYSNTIDGAGVYHVKSKPKSQFHKLDYLLADFRRHFPYAKVAGLFYVRQ